jgi:hypothetical protein
VKSLARHVGHVECASSQVKRQVVWKERPHARIVMVYGSCSAFVGQVLDMCGVQGSRRILHGSEGLVVRRRVVMRASDQKV